MTILKRLACGLGGLAILFGTAHAQACGSINIVGGTTQSGCINIGGADRPFQVYAPSSYNAGSPTNVVVGLHGGNVDSMEDFIGYSNLNATANSKGFVAVYLQAYKDQWNDGREESKVSSFPNQRKDVEFITTALNLVEAVATVDKVFVMGMSNGGMMSIRMACEASNRIAGVAVVSALMHKYQDTLVCGNASAIPIVFIHGNSDPVINKKYDKAIGWSPKKRGRTAGEDKTIAFWKGINGCSSTGITKRGQKFGSMKADVHNFSCSRANMGYFAVRWGFHQWFQGVTPLAYDFLNGS